ncbi:MAG: hypothetical protein ACO1TE_20380 [Prosthecobacter sp.]
MASFAHARELNVVLVQGASGTEEFGKKFQTQVEAWKTACAKGEVAVEVISGPETTARLEKRLSSADPKKALWLVLIGHGTFDGREAKFSAEGPDFDAKQLGTWLAPLKQEIVVVHNASASGGFLRPLAGKNRVIITSTKSPDEVFYARFGEYFAEAIGGLQDADLDQDKQVSLLEAFVHASKGAATFYENEGRLATEHALLDDNGDALGTRHESLQPDAKAAAGVKTDGERAAQLALVLSDEEKKLTDAQRNKRDSLEMALKKLREQREKTKMTDDVYYSELEKLLRELGEVYGGS